MTTEDIIDLGLTYSEKRRRVQEHVKAFRQEQAPPTLYRADLFRRVKGLRYGENVSTLGLKEIARECSLSVNTVKAVLDGNGSKIENIYRIARYFGVPWEAVFDVNKRLTLDAYEDGTGLYIVSIDDVVLLERKADRTTPKKASPPATKSLAYTGAAILGPKVKGKRK